MRAGVNIVLVAAIFFLRPAGADPLDDCTSSSDLQRVIDGCTRLIRLHKSNDDVVSSAHNNLGTAFLNLGEVGLAFAHYDRAIELNPRFSNALYNRGSARLKIGKHAGAIADFDAVIAIDPLYMAAYNNRGLAHEQADSLEAAYADFSKAIGLAPDIAVIHINRGVVLRKLKRSADALADFHRAVELNPETVRARMQIAEMHLLAGSARKAVELYRKVLTIAPDHREANERLQANVKK